MKSADLLAYVTCVCMVILTFRVFIFLRVKPTTPTISLELLKEFQTWIDKSIALYMTRYISEITGREMIKDIELSINGEFAIKGIKYVGDNIVRSMPSMFKYQMTVFYGTDVLLLTINDRIQAVFTEYVNNEMSKRVRSDRMQDINK